MNPFSPTYSAVLINELIEQRNTLPPNVCISLIRYLHSNKPATVWRAEKVQLLFERLDSYLSTGGNLPTEWSLSFRKDMNV
jgi:hypothetical protein